MSEPNSIDIDYIASLARLALTDEEKSLFSEQLDEVLGYIGKLEEVEIGDVEPMVHVFSSKNIWEEDQATEPMPVEAALQNAPVVRENMIAVPKVVD